MTTSAEYWGEELDTGALHKIIHQDTRFSLSTLCLVELLNIPQHHPPPTIRIFAGDITIDNIVFYNPMTIYLLTMDNGRGDLRLFTFSGL